MTGTLELRPLLITVDEVEAALKSVYDDAAMAETVHSARRKREPLYRIVKRRFDVRISDELLRQRLEEIEEAKRAGVSARRQ